MSGLNVSSIIQAVLERVGTLEGSGSVTGLYTVLVEGGDFDEPIADAARSILDGHICLSRQLAVKNHYPAVDILGSISRVMRDVVDQEHVRVAGEIMNIVATYRKAEDLINIGAYVQGSNPEIDNAVKMIEKVNRFVRQEIDQRAGFQESKQALFELLKK